MSFLKRFPASIALVLGNVAVFVYLRIHIGTFADPYWTQGLLFNGANFAPLSLDHEWYRTFTHMFLHGNLMHLLFNMYALVAIGSEVEAVAGTRRFLWVYFLSGLTGSIASLQFNLFTIGVGASGAIFGLFGFALVLQIIEGRRQDRAIAPILVNFGIFLLINVLFAKALNADNAAHMGGLAGGLLMGIGTWSPSWRVQYVLLPVVLLVFFSLPRYQVRYFNFFQSVLSVEDEGSKLSGSRNMGDEEFLQGTKALLTKWDSTGMLLDNQTHLPEVLHRDTFNLRRYIDLRKKEARYRIDMIEKQTFRYYDSIELAQEQMRQFVQLSYPLVMLRPIPDKSSDSTSRPQLEMAQVWYNEEWEELPEPPGEFYRIGQRDSAGRWQGWVRDHYANGSLQMKGFYRNNLRDGIFLYYSDHHTYTSAGLYRKDVPEGKWETFHQSGRLKSEEYYRDGYFMKAMWDADGRQLVIDGEGRYEERYANGVIAEEGEYRNGKREGLWTGRHEDGTTHFEEYFQQGILIRGRSRASDGQTFVYDASSLFPMPEGGNIRLVEYLEQRVMELQPSEHGVVRVTFRVTTNRVLTDFVVDEGLTAELDSKAIEFIRSGPPWLPARDHGHLPRSGFARVSVTF
jgi:membrane associated rhomboid family serine protease